MTSFAAEQQLSNLVNASVSTNAPERLAKVMASLVNHLHAIVQEMALTKSELEQAIDFLTRAGKSSTDTCNEFVVLCDTFGISTLISALGNPKPASATPVSEFGAVQTSSDTAEPCQFQGRIVDVDGNPIAGAMVSVGSGAEPHQTREDGRYFVVGTKPSQSSIPDQGPAGELLGKLGRRCKRPAHAEFHISAPGYEPLHTRIFVAGDPLLTTDPVFGVKEPLIVPFKATASDTNRNLWTARYDFVLVAQIPNHPKEDCTALRRSSSEGQQSSSKT